MIGIDKKKFNRMSRSERKKKEFEMAVVRTVFNVIAGIVAVVGLLFTLLIYHKVYFNGG